MHKVLNKYEICSTLTRLELYLLRTDEFWIGWIPALMISEIIRTLHTNIQVIYYCIKLRLFFQDFYVFALLHEAKCPLLIMIQSKHVRMSRCQDVRMSGCQDVRMSECQDVRLSVCQYVRVSGCQNVGMSRVQEVRMSGW